jgi:heptosyltransferase-2
MGKRILIIKLAATGDVIRTTPVLRALKADKPSFITWVTEAAAYQLLRSNDKIDRLLRLDDPDTVPSLLCEKFDLIACLDKEPRATRLAERIPADRKIGYGITSYGTLRPLSSSTEYSFQLGIDDELKFRKNEKSYPELLFDIFELPYNKEEYYLPLPSSVKAMSHAFMDKWDISNEHLVIGLNTGSGKRFATKRWPVEYYVQLGSILYRQFGDALRLLLLGGPEEESLNKEIESHLNQKNIPVINTGCHNSLLDFCSIVELCHLLVTSDTLAMHLAIALRKKTLVLVGSTCHQELELYDRGIKMVVSTDQFPCSPCYRGQCNQDTFCMATLTPEDAFKNIEILLKS